MRELKFRIWSEEDKEYRSDIKISDLVIDKDGVLSTIYNREGDRFDIEQYTGLKDKNGKEIYEGDIVDVIFPTKLRGVEEHQIWVCRFGIKRAGFVMNRETNARIFSLTFGDINSKNIAVEVIGNIHENDNLLGE